MNLPAIIQSTPDLMDYAQNANHIDVKVFEGEVSLREFIAGMFSYYPSWIKFLYRVRWGFVRLLGMKQEGIPQGGRMKPDDVSFIAGEKATFFTIHAAKENEYWLAGATESHLSAYLGVIARPTQDNHNQFHVITIVKYHRWTGPVYFNVIRPFHHVVVGQMAQAGAHYQRT